MRTSSKINKLAPERRTGPLPGGLYRLAAASHDDDAGSGAGSAASPVERPDELPYRVELWDQTKTSVEQVLAVTRNGSIGYAAYYEATRQFPNRYITLRHQGRILSRFNGPTH